MRASLRLGGIGWMIIAQACFAGMNLFTRLGARDLPWPEVAGARFLVGALVAWGLAQARGSSLRVSDRRNTWGRSIFGTLAAIGTFYALASDRIPLGDAATLSATAPVFVALLSGRLLDERVGSRVGFAVLLAFAGVVAVVRPTFAAAAPVAAVATAGACFYALAMIWLRKIGPYESAEAIILHYSCTASVVMLLLAVPVWVTPDLRGGLFLVATGLAGGAAQVAMTRAYALDTAARISTFNYLGIVFTHLLAIPVFGAIPTVWQIGGALLVITAGIMLARGAGARRGSVQAAEAAPEPGS